MVPREEPHHARAVTPGRLRALPGLYDLRERATPPRDSVAERPHQRKVKLTIEPPGPEIPRQARPLARPREGLSEEEVTNSKPLEALMDKRAEEPSDSTRHHRHRVDPQPIEVEALKPPEGVINLSAERVRSPADIGQIICKLTRLDITSPVTDPTTTEATLWTKPLRVSAHIRVRFMDMVEDHVEDDSNPTAMRFADKLI
jgi:hypothetical protein